MGKIRVRTLGDETQEKAQKQDAKIRREQKKMAKAHIKGVGLKGGQQVSVVDGVELKPEIEQLLKTDVIGQAESKKPEKKAKKIKVRVRSKRYQNLLTQIDKSKFYPLSDAVNLIIKTATTKFDATVDMHINLNPETITKEKPTISGSVTLPHGTGKERKIAILDDKLLTDIEKGKIEFDILVTHPQYMAKLAKFARILGPKGLMPNPKNGTITTTPEKRAKELSGGEFVWKNEPDHPVVHQRIGKVSFGSKKLVENIQALVKSISSNKIVKITLASSMGPGVKVDLNTI